MSIPIYSIKQLSSQKAVLYAEGNVGDPVLHFGNGIFDRQRLKVMRIFLTVVNKMSITLLIDVNFSMI